MPRSARPASSLFLLRSAAGTLSLRARSSSCSVNSHQLHQMMHVSLFVHTPGVLNNFCSVIASKSWNDQRQKFLFHFKIFARVLGVPERIIHPLGQSLPIRK